jgi:hypothetical protein
LKNFINVDKLKRLRDEPREVLYNRHRPTQQTFSTDNEVLAQRTVQPAIEQRADGAQNSLNAIGTVLKLVNDNSLWHALQREQDETGKVIYIEKSEQAQDINLNETSCTRVQSPQLQSVIQRNRQMDLELQMKRSDLVPWASTASQQLPVRNPTRTVHNNAMEISATHGTETPMFPRSVKVFEQQMHRGRNPIAIELQEDDDNLQFMTVDDNNNDSPTTRGSNLTAQSEIMHAVHDRADSKLRNRKAWTEQIVLATHKLPSVNSGHAQSRDSIEDSVEPINSARTDRHGEAALTANASQTFISNASATLVKTNEDCCNEADNTASDTKIKDNLNETNESFTNPLLQSADLMHHTLSTGLDHHPAEKAEYSQKQQVKTNHDLIPYRRVDLNTTAAHTDDRIIRVSAGKAVRPYPLYKAHFNDKTKPCRIPVTAILPEIVAAFHVKCFQQKKTRKLTE